MASPFRFAVQTGPFTDLTKLRGYARLVENLGYHELYTADHLGSVDPFLPLLVAAEATTTLRFGPLVLNNELHNTGLLARSAATLDVLSGGRLTLGLGTGYAQHEHDALDIPLRPPGRRVTRFGESIAALRELLDSGQVHTNGLELQLHIDDLGVRPSQQHVPFLIGGNGRRVVALGARHADIFQLTGLSHDAHTGTIGVGGFTRSEVARRVAWLHEDAGDRIKDIEVSALVQQTDLSGTPEGLRRVADSLELSDELLHDTPFAYAGEPAAVVEQLQRNREELGISHLVIRDPQDFAPVVETLNGT